ncbi:Uncharacterised protein [Pantoea agglomerans]|uniref:Uncharacterized protein n=1 Tax=Enterobacter agglomerans TaxID=549 RepID=A0A379LTU2_ENTAG|nr:Uncharacterised protein [Pantoea agglomerans]
MQELLKQRILCRRESTCVALLSNNLPFGFIAVSADAPAALRQHHRFHRHLIHGERARFYRSRSPTSRPGVSTVGSLRIIAWVRRHRLHAQRQDDRDNGRQTFRNRSNRQADDGQRELARWNVTQQIAEDKTGATIISRMMKKIALPSLSICTSSGVLTSFMPLIISLIWPSSVSPPLAITTPAAVPELTVVPEKARFRRFAQRFFTAQRIGVLRHHRRLPGENRLFNPKIIDLKQSQISRDFIAGGVTSPHHRPQYRASRP